MRTEYRDFRFRSRATVSFISTRRIPSMAQVRFFSTALWILFWGISFTPSSLGLGHNTERKAASGAGSPVWRVDLRSVGYTGFAPKQEQAGFHLRPNPLCFSEDKVLIASFITREDVTALARRNEPNATLPLRLHAIFFDAEAGEVRDTKEWSITRPRGGVIAAGDGRFVVLTPAMVALYSPSLELVKDFGLSSDQQSHLWNFHVSSSGKSILAEYHYSGANYQWLDSDSLQPQGALWRESLPVLSISDDKEIASFRDTYVKAKGYISEALIQPRNGPERTVCRVLAGQGDSCGSPRFLSNDVLALWMSHGFSVVPRSGGDALLRATLSNDEWLGNALYPSADGKRFAVTVWEHKGGSAIFDVSSHNVLKRIMVYDIPSRQAVYTLYAKQQKIKDVSGVALSPDGQLMAIMTDGVVQLYQLAPM
jgi:hypothetical protein